MSADRSMAAWAGVQHAQDPMGAYARMYRARVVAQSDDADRVDVRPDDPMLPDMAQVPLRHGVPGLRVQVAMGSYLLVGWDDGRPDKAFATLWNPGVRAVSVSLVSDEVKLGSRDAVEAFVLGTSYRMAEDVMVQGLQQGLAMLAAVCTVGPLATLQPGLQLALASVTQFIGAAAAQGGYLSLKVRGE